MGIRISGSTRCRLALVKQVRRASYNEVIRYWFNYEYDSRQDFQRAVDQRLGAQALALRQKGLDDPAANSVRLAIMQAWRSFVLQGFDQAEWSFITFDDVDLPVLRLIDSGDWRDITSGSLDPMVAAKRVGSDASLRTGPYAQQVNFILTRVESLATTPSRIVIAGIDGGPLTVVDGVHRIVAACLYYKVRNKTTMGAREAYFGSMQRPYSVRFT